MSKNKKMSILKRLSLLGVALYVSATTVIAGLPTSMIPKLSKNKSNPKPSINNEEKLNEAVPSKKALQEIALDSTHEEDNIVQQQEPIIDYISDSNYSTSEKITSNIEEESFEDLQNEPQDSNIIYEEAYERPIQTMEDDIYSTINALGIDEETFYSHLSNKTYTRKAILDYDIEPMDYNVYSKIISSNSQSFLTNNTESYSLLNADAPEFNCPRYETEEQREARLKEKQKKWEQEVLEEQKAYQAYLASIYEPLLKEYSKYYHLDGNKVVDIAKKLTNNYTIDINKFTNTTEYNTDILEASIMIFVAQLSQNKLTVNINSLGHSLASLSTNAGIETIKPNLILSSGQSYTQFLGKVCDLIGVDKTAALAISFHETGWVKSYLARYKNNFGGLMGMSFKTPEEGIIAFVRTIKGYEKFGLKLSQNYSQLVSFSCYYVNGSFSNPAYSWVGNVEWFIGEINRNNNKYFPSDNKTIEINSYMILSREKKFG